jgi:hypothetical protein
VLGGGCSNWGAKNGETLELLKSEGERSEPTGMKARVRNRKPLANEEWDGVALLDFDFLQCPHCNADGTIHQTLTPESCCPQCRDGTIEIAGTCIY